MDKGDKDPNSDVENLKKAAAKIGDAAELVRNVGWHGAKALTPLAIKRTKKELGARFIPEPSNEQAKEILADILERIAGEIKTAEQSINRDAPSVWTNLGGTKTPVTKAKIIAFHVAKGCYCEFERLAGQKPTRSTDRETDGQISPYYRFTMDVFDALQIDGKPEWYCRMVIKKRKEEGP